MEEKFEWYARDVYGQIYPARYIIYDITLMVIIAFYFKFYIIFYYKCYYYLKSMKRLRKHIYFLEAFSWKDFKYSILIIKHRGLIITKDFRDL